MSTFLKVNSFVEKSAEKSFNLGSDQLKVALTNTAHTSTWSQLSELTLIDTTNLSGATPLNLTTVSSAQTSGTYKLVVSDLTLTATNTVPAFQYIYVYDDTATNKELICYCDKGATITMGAGDSTVLDFDGSGGLLTLA